MNLRPLTIGLAAFALACGARPAIPSPQEAAIPELEKRITLEILTGIVRAGADFVLTYHAKDAAKWLKDGSLSS